MVERRIICLAVLLAGLLAAGEARAQTFPVVRVGLLTLGRPAEFKVASPAPFAAYLPDTNELLADYDANSIAVVRAEGDLVRIGDKAVTNAYFSTKGDRLKLMSPAGIRSYRGWIHFSSKAGKLTAVNEVSLETYLMGVVPCEMPPSWHPEALKAQAVAARTYTITRIGAFPSEGFDVDDTTRCHTYKGIDSEDQRSNEAIRLTSNQILIYKGRPIEALYATVSGGVTASAAEAYGGPGLPYLVSIVDADEQGRPYAAAASNFNWTAEFSPADFAKLFPGTAFVLDRVEVESRWPSGRVATVAFYGKFSSGGGSGPVTLDDGKQVISSSKVRQALGVDVVKSTLFDIAKSPDGWKFSGKGWGHGVGMCQAGANGRAMAGQTYEEILKAYYVGVELITVRGSPLELATRGSKVNRQKYFRDAR